MYDDILLPIDGSNSMADVVDGALDLASADATTVHLLYVVDTRAFLTLDDPESTARELRATGEAALERAADRIEAAGLAVTTAVRRGDPAAEIVAHADATGVDAVVMGAHAEYEENLLGSVSQGVLANSPVPVLTVQLSSAAAAPGERPAGG